jgi:hypothetical protein
MRPDEFALGVDIGQTSDPSAIAVLRRVPKWTGLDRKEYEPGSRTPQRFFEYADAFHLGHLERLPLHTPYSGIAVRVGQILDPCSGGAHAVIDATGVGRPVVETMQHLPIVPVTITSGQGTNHDWDGFKVGKKVLVSNAQVAIQNGRLVISKSLPKLEDLDGTPSVVVRTADELEVDALLAGVRKRRALHA